MNGGAPAWAPPEGPSPLPGAERCGAMLAEHLVAVRRRFGSPGLGVVDVPPLTEPGRIEPVQLRAVAVLFWAMQMEGTGILDFADGLARGSIDGTLLLPITSGGDALMAYWHERRERFSREERLSLYQRLFGASGAPSADGFAGQFDALCLALSELGRASVQEGTAHRVARINFLGRQLAQYLSDHGAGITAFAAREIYGHIHAARALLDDPDLRHALGGGDAWQAIRLHAPMVLGHPIEPGPFLERAQAGAAVLAWLADVAPALEAGTLQVGREDPGVIAAEQWIAATGAA